MRSRRSLLAAGAGTLAALAGCVGRRDAGGNEPSTSDTTSTATTTTSAATSSGVDPEPALFEFGTDGSFEGATVTPTGGVVQSSLFSLTTADQMGVIDPDGRQLLFFDVAVDGGGFDADEFLLEAGDRSYVGWTTYDGTRGHSLAPRGRRGEQYSTSEPTGWIGFELPYGLSADEFRLTLDSGDAPAWVLPEDHASALRDGEPEFELLSVEVPETVESAESIPFAATVENAGDGPGTFRFVVNYRGPTYAPARQRIDLAAGERRDWETELDPYGTRSAEQVEFAVTTATSERDYAVTVDGGGS